MRPIKLDAEGLSVEPAGPEEVVVALEARDVAVVMCALRAAGGAYSQFLGKDIPNGGEMVSTTETDKLLAAFTDAELIAEKPELVVKR